MTTDTCTGAPGCLQTVLSSSCCICGGVLCSTHALPFQVELGVQLAGPAKVALAGANPEGSLVSVEQCALYAMPTICPTCKEETLAAARDKLGQRSDLHPPMRDAGVRLLQFFRVLVGLPAKK